MTASKGSQSGDFTEFRCPSCGGEVRFDAAAQKFMCVSCKSVQEIKPPKDTVEEYDFGSYDAREQGGAALVGVSNATCDNCGGEIYFSAEDTAKHCPMCGSSKIRPAAAVAGIAPEGIVPFKFDKFDAQDRFRKWIVKRWFAPNELKKAYSEGALEGLYVPFWTYDASARGDYIGQGGRVRTVRDREGNVRQVVDWYPVSGTVFDDFDDILVCASKSRSGSLVEKVSPYNTVSDINPFAVQYLAGYVGERYTIDGKTCFDEARIGMEQQLRSLAESDILMHGFQQANVSSLHSSYKNVTYKNVLLPMYSAQYGYHGEEYYYLINGETGKVAGAYPKSVPKIIGAVILGIIALVGLFFLMEKVQSADEGSVYYSLMPQQSINQTLLTDGVMQEEYEIGQCGANSAEEQELKQYGLV
ncbi:MAG: hypothetical protein RR368_02490 [Oscillospiraceae bacterium]